MCIEESFDYGSGLRRLSHRPRGYMLCIAADMARTSLSAALLATVVLVACSACGPRMPPKQAPAQPNPTFEPFRHALQTYIERTQPYRREAAEAQESTPGRGTPTPNAAAALRTRQAVLAEALRTKLRPNAKQGELFTPAIADAIRHEIAAIFDSPRRYLILDELTEQNTTPPHQSTPVINQPLKAPRIPPRLRESLPTLPEQLEYDFDGRTLVLRDVDADVVVDFLPNALPVAAPTEEPAAQGAAPEPGTVSPLPMPSVRSATTFAVMGDSGSGDLPQQQVAEAMLTYFNTARHFPFVLMLGDNLYHDDYDNEFLVPYKPLLDRGVKFYATLGNHDRDLEIHFKPFNMGDRDRYSFDEGNARFVALNSNHPADVEQLKWLDGAFADADDKWRIVFFHHPMYSSGIHGAEGRDVIRPAFEDTLVRHGVNVVFAGHEHLYERIAPQRGIYQFVSGGGGRNLYKVRPSDFDEVTASEHHFMVVQIAGDRMLFEAISHGQKLIDCGAIFRTARAGARPDGVTTKWLAACESARPKVTTTQPD
jgi:calcineurin-like phosphoesterase family protein